MVDEDETAYFWEKVDIAGNWMTSKCIYNCDNLEQSTQLNCDGFILSDNELTIQDKDRRVEIREVKTEPNNAAATYRSNLYMKFRLDTTLPKFDNIHDVLITITVPSDYGLTSNMNRQDIHTNFYSEVSYGTNKIMFKPLEEMKLNVDYTFWVVQGVTNPSSNDAEADAYTGYTEY